MCGGAEVAHLSRPRGGGVELAAQCGDPRPRPGPRERGGQAASRAGSERRVSLGASTHLRSRRALTVRTLECDGSARLVRGREPAASVGITGAREAARRSLCVAEGRDDPARRRTSDSLGAEVHGDGPPSEEGR